MAENSSFKKIYWYSGDFFDEGSAQQVHVYLHANYRYTMHAHQFYEINIITAGEGEHLIEGAVLPTGAGDVFVIPPEIRHCYVGREHLDVYHVLLSPIFLQKYREELSALSGFAALFDIEPYLRGTAGKRCNLHLSPAELQEISEVLHEISVAQQKGEYMHQTLLTLPLVSRLCLLFDGKMHAAQAPGGGDAELLRILEFVRENLGEKLTLARIAAFGNMSRATLTRRFRAALHCAPMEYVLSCRVQRARELLAAGEYSKSEIAQLCGFYDSAHMNRNLKSAHG